MPPNQPDPDQNHSHPERWHGPFEPDPILEKYFSAGAGARLVRTAKEARSHYDNLVASRAQSPDELQPFWEELEFDLYISAFQDTGYFEPRKQRVINALSDFEDQLNRTSAERGAYLQYIEQLKQAIDWLQRLRQSIVQALTEARALTGTDFLTQQYLYATYFVELPPAPDERY